MLRIALFISCILPAVALAQPAPTTPSRSVAGNDHARPAAAHKPAAPGGAGKPNAGKPGAAKPARSRQPAPPTRARRAGRGSAPPAPAAPVVPAEPAKGSNTGLPLPRFASLEDRRGQPAHRPGPALPDRVGLQAPRPAGADRARVRGLAADRGPGGREGLGAPGHPGRAPHLRRHRGRATIRSDAQRLRQRRWRGSSPA